MKPESKPSSTPCAIWKIQYDTDDKDWSIFRNGRIVQYHLDDIPAAVRAVKRHSRYRATDTLIAYDEDGDRVPVRRPKIPPKK
jgi:hypothetical protein